MVWHDVVGYLILFVQQDNVGKMLSMFVVGDKASLIFIVQVGQGGIDKKNKNVKLKKGTNKQRF